MYILPIVFFPKSDIIRLSNEREVITMVTLILNKPKILRDFYKEIENHTSFSDIYDYVIDDYMKTFNQVLETICRNNDINIDKIPIYERITLFEKYMYKVESCYIEMIQEDISEQTMIGCTWIKNGVDKDKEM